MRSSSHRRIVALATIIIACSIQLPTLRAQGPSPKEWGPWSITAFAGFPQGISPSMRGTAETFRRDLKRDYNNHDYPFADAGWQLSDVGGEIAYSPLPAGIYLAVQRTGFEMTDEDGQASMTLLTDALGAEYVVGTRDEPWNWFARAGLCISMIDGYTEYRDSDSSSIYPHFANSTWVLHTTLTTALRYGAEAAIGGRYNIPRSRFSLEASAAYMNANIGGKSYVKPAAAPPNLLTNRELNDGANPDDPSDHDRSIAILLLRAGIRVAF